MSTRNISWKVKAAFVLGLTTLPPSCADYLVIWEPQPPGTLRAPPLLPPVNPRGAPRQATWETSGSEERKWATNFAWKPDFQVFQESLTCRKSATWDRRLYFPSEGRRAEDFFARKIRRLRPGLNPRSWVPEARTLTTRPPKSRRLLKWIL
jgi:hypothetical protein